MSIRHFTTSTHKALKKYFYEYMRSFRPLQCILCLDMVDVYKIFTLINKKEKMKDARCE